MSPSLIAAVVTVIVNLLTAVFVYGKLTQRVSDHSRRLDNVETIVSGPGGHGERITRLEGARLKPQAHHGD